MFEAVDVIALIKGGVYDDLNLTVGDALLKRSDVRNSLALQNRKANFCRISLVSSPAR